MTNHLFDALLGSADGERIFAHMPGDAWSQLGSVGKPPRDRWSSYADALDVSARFARTLVGWGVGPGDRVAVQVEKSIEAVLLYVACIRAGAVFLPLNTAYTAAEVTYFLSDAEPRVFLCDPSKAAAMVPVAREAGARLETMGVIRDVEDRPGTIFEATTEKGAAFENVPRGPDDLAAILYTSGTTGRSKGAMLSHENLAHNARTLREAWRFTRDDVLLHALPIFHTHGLFVASNVTMTAGSSLIFMPSFSLDALIRHMDRATVLMGVPTFYTRLLKDERFDRSAARGMRLFVSGSAPLLAETHRAFERRTGSRILERYGMTETNMNTSNPYSGERRAGTVGLPLPGTELRIIGEDGNEVRSDEPGNIEVRGANVFSGYWRMPEKTAEEFTPDGWFRTGDLGRRSEDGYVTIIGRDKDMIISGGFNVYPVEVEDAIDQVEGVEESAVIGLPHDDLGEAVTAVVVRSGSTDDDPDEAAIIEGVRDRLARYKQPKRVLFAAELPRNTMGKVQKARLRADHANLYR